MEDAVWWNPRDVRAALARLGLTAEPLQDAVQGGVLARISRTANDAPSAPGFYQWNETLRMLRELLVAKGWERSNEDGFATVVNPAKGIALSVSSGNESTGIASEIPSTKYPKGPCTVDRVATNAQMELFPEASPPARTSYEAGTIPTWTLLFVTDEHEVRSELSLPVFMDGGQINGWRERIILPAIPLDGNGSKRTPQPDFGPDVDIEIRRRA